MKPPKSTPKLSIDDIDKSLDMRYIRSLENPDSVGYDNKNKVWRQPKSKKFDVNQIGMGLDVRDATVAAYLAKKGRTSNPYLTEQEERELRAQIYQLKKGVVDRTLKRHNVKTNAKDYAIMMGMAWQGDPMGKINTPGSVTRQAVQPLIDAGKPIGQAAFNAYYSYPSNATRYSERIKSHNNF